MNVIDNFLPEEEFKFLQDLIVFNDDFPFYLNDSITYPENTHKVWEWYATHLFYNNDQPTSDFYNHIQTILISKFRNLPGGFRTLLRVKANFYPSTPVLQEHKRHYDYEWSHSGAVFSLNTCDGFTRLSDGSKVDSVANRLLLFDPSEKHNSTSTTNQRGRFNINFNWL